MNNNKRLADEISKKSTTANPVERRISLATIFSGAFLSILAILIIVNTAISLRLTDFQTILSKLTGDVLPKAALSGKTFDKVNGLTYLTARLSSSPSQAFRLIAYRDVKNKINQIADLELVSEKTSVLKNQLDSILNEIEGLNNLIEDRIKIQLKSNQQAKNLYKLHSLVLSISLNNVSEKNRQFFYSWVIDFTEIITLSSKALASQRLNEVRQISNYIKTKIKTITGKSSQLIFVNHTNAMDLVNQLKTIINKKDGLQATHIQKLRTVGQVRGRSNFVHNLVEDFSRQVQFQFHHLNSIVIKDAENTTERIERGSDLLKIMIVFSILFLIGTIYFLNTKIIKRLTKLNVNVLERIKGGKLNLTVKGNDEISDIAKSFNLLIEEIEKQKRTLRELSLTDGLTGIANRRSLDRHLLSTLVTAQKNKTSLSLLMMDVDYFKKFNDHYGHLAGDDCLKDIANAFKGSTLRKDDFVARFGGEEFVMILPQTNLIGAKMIAESVLKAVSSLKITHEWSDTSPYVTISIGVATFDPNDPISDEALLMHADKALFYAKAQGKNCVASFTD